MATAEKKGKEYALEFAASNPLTVKSIPTADFLLEGGGDLRYDDVLLAYKKLGGTLNDFQERRLWQYGYLGEPRERLSEFLHALEE